MTLSPWLDSLIHCPQIQNERSDWSSLRSFFDLKFSSSSSSPPPLFVCVCVRREDSFCVFDIECQHSPVNIGEEAQEDDVTRNMHWCVSWLVAGPGEASMVDWTFLTTTSVPRCPPSLSKPSPPGPVRAPDQAPGNQVPPAQQCPDAPFPLQLHAPVRTPGWAWAWAACHQNCAGAPGKVPAQPETASALSLARFLRLHSPPAGTHKVWELLGTTCFKLAPQLDCAEGQG